MYPSPDSHIRQAVAVLFSQRSRDRYAEQATVRGDTYSFTDAWDQPKTWLMGEFAYLAPNAASMLLARCNLKHDLVEEAELTQEALGAYRAILVPNAGQLADATIEHLARWLRDTDGRLLVTGKTNLPDALLGLDQRIEMPVDGYSGWKWRPDSPFGDLRAWEGQYLTGYRGHTTHQVQPSPGSRVLADLIELDGDLTSARTATQRPLGAAIVLTERTAYVANQVFELLGGAMQGHLNVDLVRHWSNPTHWGDTICLFLRRLLLELGLSQLWETRLRSFGAYDGVLSFRHDIHSLIDLSFINYQVQNLIPASYDLEEPSISANITPERAREWAGHTSGFGFIEQGLHNDSAAGDPPIAVHGRGLYDHVMAAERSLGYPIYTCGRHAGGHLHPETLDAMDYLYANNERVLGLCTFSFYHMIEYGVRNPDIMVRGRPVTYATDVSRTIATPGIWFPYHAVVTTDTEWRVLRGWDRTHEYDSAYELVETIFEGRHARVADLDDRLENGVYSFQYHPELANDPSKHDGKGTLGYLRYCINLAERLNYWIANQRQLYERMQDYQDVAFRVEPEARRLVVHNPTDRRVVGLAVEQRSVFGSVWEGSDELVHLVHDRIISLPPLGPGELKTLRFETEPTAAPRLLQPSSKGLVVLDARHDHAKSETRILVSVCRDQWLRVEQVAPETRFLVQVDDDPPLELATQTVFTTKARLSAQALGATDPFAVALIYLSVPVGGEYDRFVERTIRIRPA